MYISSIFCAEPSVRVASAVAPRVFGLLILLATLAGVSGPVLAQQKKTAADPAVAQALRKAQSMLQELSTQNAQLNDEVVRLRAQVEALTPKTRQLEKAERDLAQQTSAVGDLREQYRTVVERTYRDAARIIELQEIDTQQKADNTLLALAVKEREQWMAVCSKRNEKLRQVGTELLDRYRQKGVWQALKNAEPVTGIAELSEEREAQTYRFKLEDLKVPLLTSGGRVDS